MRKCSPIKRFKIFVACTVILLMTLLFVTVQPVQARDNLSEPSTTETEKIVEEETIDSSTTDTDERRILDGASDVANEGDTLIIEDGVKLIVKDNHAVKMENGDNSVTNKGRIEVTVTGGVRRLRHISPFTHAALTPPSSIAVR